MIKNMDEVTLKDIVESNFREHGLTLARIEAQTLKTNGRVNKLENWRSMLVGAWIVFTIILLPTAFFVLELLFGKK